MLANTFSHGLIRDFVIAFGTLFNNIKINRRAASGEDVDTIAIPLAYAPQQRYLERITQDLNLDRPVALTLPRISFELLSLNYSTERKLNTMQRWVGHGTGTSNTEVRATYSPVPYDFNFQLSIYISNIEDGTHIVEQILPYFTPEFTVSLKAATDLELNMDLPIVLNSVNMEDSYEGGFEERRIIIWTLDFTLKGNLFGPTADQIITNKVLVNIHTKNQAEDDATANNYDQIITQPALFANGETTTRSALSVTPGMISSNSDYGISQSIFAVGEDPNIYKFWGFNEGAMMGIVALGSAAGNTTIDGWETLESTSNPERGTVALSKVYNHMRHTITKVADPATAYQSPMYLRTYSNTSPYLFNPFYGTQFQNVSIRYKTKQTTGDDATHVYNGSLRWLTTNSGEDSEFTSNDDRHNAEVASPIATGGGQTNYDTLAGGAGDYFTITWDLSGDADWNNRIITALQFNLFTAIDNTGEAVIETDIDYIKIYATPT